MKQLQTYTYTIPANGSVQIPATNDNFIIQAATGPLTVRGDTFGTLVGLVAGQGLKDVPFNRLELFDQTGAPNTVTILLTPAEFVNQVFSGSVGIVGAIALNAATINSLNRPEAPTGTWADGSANVANTAKTIFTPAANVNGAILLMATATESLASAGFSNAFVAKSSTPASPTDGDLILAVGQQGANASSNFVCTHLPEKQRIAPGQGLYYVPSAASGGIRGARFILL